jgi:sulfur relay (sulfurtransferase) DsrC/TusE family protein
MEKAELIKVIEDLKLTTLKTEYQGLERIKEWVISRETQDWNPEYISEIIQVEAEILDELHWKILHRVRKSTK